MKEEYMDDTSKIIDLEHKIKLLKLENKSLKEQLEFYIQRAIQEATTRAKALSNIHAFQICFDSYNFLEWIDTEHLKYIKKQLIKHIKTK